MFKKGEYIIYKAHSFKYLCKLLNDWDGSNNVDVLCYNVTGFTNLQIELSKVRLRKLIRYRDDSVKYNEGELSYNWYKHCTRFIYKPCIIKGEEYI